MQRLLLFLIVFCVVGSTLALGQVRVTERTLGRLDPKRSESQPGVELAALIAQEPNAQVYVVTATDAVGPKAIDHNKYVYDKTSRVLLFMSRTAMPVGGDEFRWRIWRDVNVTDFKNGLPFSNSKLKTEASPFGRAKETLGLKYQAQPTITAWP